MKIRPGYINLVSNPGGGFTFPTGQILAPDGTVSAPSYAFSSNPDFGWYYHTSGAASWVLAGQGGTALVRIIENAAWMSLHGSMGFGWTSAGATSTPDVLLARDAAGTLAQRNSTNAQTLRVYNTFTNASNGEWLQAGWANNVATLQPTANGTGTLRTLTVVTGTIPAVTYSASMTPDASLGNYQTITVTNGSAFTINAPSNPATGQPLTITLRNTSGGAAGAATWNAVFKMAAWTNPANGNSRSITFLYNGTNWVEINRTTADVPN